MLSGLSPQHATSSGCRWKGVVFWHRAKNPSP